LLLPLFDDPAKGRVAAGRPEAKAVRQNSRALLSPTLVRQGQFFDIVKIGRKGNVDGEVLAVLGNTGATRQIDGTFSRGTYHSRWASAWRCEVCVLVNVHREMRTQNVQMSSDKSDIKLESLILAQNERWRQA
jgi:hypothetical protein